MTCLKEEVNLETIAYAVQLKHDGRLHSIEIPDLTIPKCKACGALTFNNTADDQVLAVLRLHFKLLMPKQIKAGRKALGLEVKDMAERLGVRPGTLSRWEKGLVIQSRAMDNFLRVYFAVPEARAVLRGPEQDPGLGRTEVPEPIKNSAQLSSANPALQT